MKRTKAGKIEEDIDRKEDATDDVTRKKIRKHLNDIHDVITDEDIKNVVVTGSKEDMKNEAVADAKKQKKIKEEQPKKPGDNEDTSLASWSILEE